MFISLYEITVFIHNTFKTIKALENMKQTVKFKHLLKDAVFGNMLSNKGLPVKLKITRKHWDMKYYHLPQSFLSTKINPKKVPKRPFLLIPLFKILDSEGKEVNYKYFKADNYNQLQVLPGGGSHYLGAERWPPVEDHKLTLNIKDNELVDLSQTLFVNHNGYLIFKDHHSDCAMVYVGIFIDQGDTIGFLDTKLGEIYKQYIKRNSQYKNKIKETDISLELELSIAKLQGRKVLDVFIQKKYVPEYEKRMGLHLNIPEVKDNPMNLKVTMKGVSLNGKLAFEITKYLNGEMFDYKFLSLYFFDRKDERDYKKFVDNLEKPKRSQRILRTLGSCIS